ncbi:MAG: succinate dehydrogenase, cytochrome b556 subunit [Burkholderiaceae bacterium]|nr:succinate dehydrogenase, cytochrome b556 subunit [Burkholderiaceae bacterium]
MSARHIEWRARGHSGWWAYLVHRVSGIALALFLPLHFFALAQSLRSEQALDEFIRFTDAPLFKFAEWALVVLLSAHLGGGLRLLAIEFGSWRGLRKSWIGVTAGATMLAGIAFALALLVPV